MTEQKRLYTIIDFETTGLDAETEQLTEVAAIKIDEEGTIYGSFHTFVELTDGRVPSPYAKVTTEQCATGISAWSALNMLHLFMADTTVVAQYAPFDFSFLEWRPKQFICTRALTHLIEPDENPSLGPTVERLGLEVLDAHRAMDDALMTREVFLIQLARAKEKGIEFENTVVDFKSRPLRFKPGYAKIIKE